MSRTSRRAGKGSRASPRELLDAGHPEALGDRDRDRARPDRSNPQDVGHSRLPARLDEHARPPPLGGAGTACRVHRRPPPSPTPRWSAFAAASWPCSSSRVRIRRARRPRAVARTVRRRPLRAPAGWREIDGRQDHRGGGTRLSPDPDHPARLGAGRRRRLRAGSDAKGAGQALLGLAGRTAPGAAPANITTSSGATSQSQSSSSTSRSSSRARFESAIRGSRAATPTRPRCKWPRPFSAADSPPRLVEAIRIERSLGYFANCQSVQEGRTGVVGIATATKTPTTRQAADVALAEVERLRTRTAPAMRSSPGVKSYLSGSIARSLQSPADIAQSLSATTFYGLPEDYITRRLERIRAVGEARLAAGDGRALHAQRAHDRRRRRCGRGKGQPRRSRRGEEVRFESLLE